MIASDVPARLDRLPWSRWHSTVVLALGVTWLLDGLENSLTANVAAVLSRPDTLGLGADQIGTTHTAYLLGSVFGALLFGRLTDTLGRKRLFLVTLAVYLAGTAACGLSTGFASFLFFRFIAGAGIGGEVAAINSAIDELVPARVRGRLNLGINGSAWLGVAIGSLLPLFLLGDGIIPIEVGWRLVFGLGAIMGIAIAIVRRAVPESPRWLLTRGRAAEAEAVVSGIEQAIRARDPGAIPREPAPRVVVPVTGSVGFLYIARTLLQQHRRRSLLAIGLLLSQSFFYNAIFFSYALILGKFYQVPPERIGLYMIPFAIGNFLGPLLLGRLFDTVGRRRMIAGTYALSAILLAATGYAFYAGWLSAVTQTICWSLVFFVAAAAASSAYLTVSELFPVELRGIAIALFFSVSQAAGSIAPTVFGRIVASESRSALFAGYAVAAGLMMIGALIAARFAVDAEGRSLEELAVAGDPAGEGEAASAVPVVA